MLCFALIKYLDKENYNILFNYVHENFSFLPKIIHTDFDKALYTSIKSNKYFGNNIIHSKCLFHFAQGLRKKLSNIGYAKNKLNKVSLDPFF